MELTEQETGKLPEYLSEFEVLIGDKRTRDTLGAVIEGIIGSESLVAAQIGRFSPWAGNE